jgi:hypothetical protein
MKLILPNPNGAPEESLLQMELILPDPNGTPEESLLQMELILPDPNGTPEESLLQMELILVLLPLGKLVALLRPETGNDQLEVRKNEEEEGPRD